MPRVLPASVRLINDIVLSIFATLRFLFASWLHVWRVSTIYTYILHIRWAWHIWDRIFSETPFVYDGARIAKGICSSSTKTITLMLSNEFLFFLFLLCFLIDELLVDVDVLVSNLLRNGFNFWCFLHHFLLYIFHEERWSCWWVMRIAARKWTWASKNTTSITRNALGIEPVLWRCHKLLARGCISAIVINVVHWDGLFTNQAIIHNQSPVLLVACTWNGMLHAILFKVVPDLISLILKPLSWGLSNVLSGLYAATCRLSLHLMLL